MSMSNSISQDILAGWTVLVIDDEPDAAEVAKLLLEMYGANVIVAKNGRAGVQQTIERRPRFVICDISMPEMNGWEFVEELKNNRTTSDIPVVALTSHAMTGDREKALAKGFHNYLTKPLNPETFVSQLLTILTVDIPELEQLLGS